MNVRAKKNAFEVHI